MRSQWLLRVLFRRKRVAAVSFLSALALGAAAALLVPLSYEAQIMLERRPARLSPQLSTHERSTEFELSRLTSETQRTVALLKSRAMMEEWASALGLAFGHPSEKEDALEELADAVAVQPVNYTDVFVLKVRADSPQEAASRAGTLADAFIKWDASQNARRSRHLISLLDEHRAEVRSAMNENLARLRRLKSEQSATLSGSPAQKKIQADIDAQQSLFNNLTAELEAARRQTESFGRTHVLAPALASADPLMSRPRRLFVAFLFAFIAALFAVAFAEWQDPSIRRAQEVSRFIPAAPVIPIPRSPSSTSAGVPPAFLTPLADNIAGVARLKGSAVVQVTNVGEGRGRTAVCASLSKLLSPTFHVTVRGKTQAPPVIAATALPSARPETAVAGPRPPSDDPPDVLIVDLEAVPDALPASNLIQRADVTCVVLSAGETSKHLLRPLKEQLERFPHQKCVLVLDGYEDPLPAALRS